MQLLVVHWDGLLLGSDAGFLTFTEEQEVGAFISASGCGGRGLAFSWMGGLSCVN